MKRIFKILFSLLVVFSAAIFGAVCYYSNTLSDSYCINEGEGLIFTDNPVISCSDRESNVVAVQKNNVFKTETFNTSVSLFGIIPVKRVSVTVSDNTEVQLLGTPFGIKIYTDGVLIIGINSVESNGNISSPAGDAGLKVGDTILNVDGVKVTSNEQMREIVGSCGGRTLDILACRNDKTFNVSVTPIFSKTDNRYMAGIWIRDSSAGIGTLTFYSPSLGVSAGLGHGICDADTEDLVPLQSGEFLEADIIGIKKSTNEITGELQGVFSGGKISDFKRNDITGVYGTNCKQFSSTSVAQVALKQEITTGSATFITCLDNEGPKLYSCEIVKIYHNDDSLVKNMVVKVTDEALLEKTGGIVQGMSGSPIIQNGKFIGAITHVFVDDPIKGYAIFAENMLETAQSVAEE